MHDPTPNLLGCSYPTLPFILFYALFDYMKKKQSVLLKMKHE